MSVVKRVVLGENGDITTLWGVFRTMPKVEIDANGAKVSVEAKNGGWLIIVNGKPIYLRRVGPLQFVCYS